MDITAKIYDIRLGFIHKNYRKPDMVVMDVKTWLLLKDEDSYQQLQEYANRNLPPSMFGMEIAIRQDPYGDETFLRVAYTGRDQD